MKIQQPTIILFFFLFLLLGNKEARSQQVTRDTVSTIIIKAQFVKRTMDEHCGFFHLPERNMFEMMKWENGKFVTTSFEVETTTGCAGGTNYIPGKTYSLSMLKIGNRILYRNVKTEPIQKFSVDKTIN